MGNVHDEMYTVLPHLSLAWVHPKRLILFMLSIVLNPSEVLATTHVRDACLPYRIQSFPLATLQSSFRCKLPQ